MLHYTLWFSFTCTLALPPLHKDEVKPFHFLVPGHDIEITTSGKSDLIGVLLKFDFTEEIWNENLKLMNNIFKSYEKLPFFSDEPTKIEYISYSAIAVENLKLAEDALPRLFAFKGNAPYVKTVVCEIILKELKIKEVKRGRMNLEKVFSKIDPLWTPALIKTDLLKQAMILAFVNQFTDFTTELYKLVNEMEHIAEQLSDGVFPAITLGKGLSCEYNTALNQLIGEEYQVLQCSQTNVGYYCEVMVHYPLKTLIMEKLHTVYYDNIRLSHLKTHNNFARVKASQEIITLHCKDDKVLHATCSIHTLPPLCKKALDGINVKEIIKVCNFTIDELVLPYLSISHGGILIQGDTQTTIDSKAIKESTPYIVYSPDDVTVVNDNEETILSPTANIVELAIVTSLVTQEDVTLLRNKIYWHDKWMNLSEDDIVNHVITLINILIIPLALLLLNCLANNKKALIKRNKHSPLRNKKEIYRLNKNLLSKPTQKV
jgi:hypothetical protein